MRGTSVGRSAQPHAATATRSVQRREHRVLDVIVRPFPRESFGDDALRRLAQKHQLV
jgi:hypothetical protein